jgi:hypothetical protein
MKISTRVAMMVGATAIAASALATVSSAADAATYTSSSALKCHYNVVHVLAPYRLWVFKHAYRHSAVLGSLSSTAKRVPGACTKTHGTNSDPMWFIEVKASNGRIGYTGALLLQKVK